MIALVLSGSPGELMHKIKILTEDHQNLIALERKVIDITAMADSKILQVSKAKKFENQQ